MTNAERQRRYKAKQLQAGFVQVNIMVPMSAVASFQEAAELCRANPRLSVARLVNSETGRLCGIKQRQQVTP